MSAAWVAAWVVGYVLMGLGVAVLWLRDLGPARREEFAVYGFLTLISLLAWPLLSLIFGLGRFVSAVIAAGER